MPDPVTESARIFIVDDHAVVRHGLSAMLARDPSLRICGEAATYEEGLEGIRREKPDVAIVDITLKDRSGLDLVRELRAGDPDIKALILSMHDEGEYADRALRAGARGYVMKEQADEAIVEALRAVLRGEIYVSSAVQKKMLREMVDGTAATTSPEAGIAALTEREREVFERLGRGYTTRKIAEELALSARTVEVHRANIKRKLGCDDAAQVLREAVKFVEGRR